MGFIARQQAMHAECDIVMAFLSVRLSIQCWSCVYANGHAVKLFYDLVWALFLFFETPTWLQNSKGRPLRGCVKYIEGGKDLQILPFSSGSSTT